MEDFIIVQKETKDEWNIGYTLEGNISSNNLVVMVHGGGYDRDENGKAILIKKLYGNYQRLSYELQANDIDTAILRIYLRNHGKSLVNGKMDSNFIREDNKTLIDYDADIYEEKVEPVVKNLVLDEMLELQTDDYNIYSVSGSFNTLGKYNYVYYNVYH